MRIDVITITSIFILGEMQTILCDNIIMPKEPYEKSEGMFTEQRRKKPFCNAFTGCGRKRSDESIAMLIEMNPEAAAVSSSSDLQESNKDGSTFDQDDDDEADTAANLWRILRQARTFMEASSTKRPKEPRNSFERSLASDGARRNSGKGDVGTNFEKPRWLIADGATNPLLRLPSAYAPKKMRTSESEYVVVAQPSPLSLRRHSKDMETRTSWYNSKAGDVKTLRLKFA